MRISMRSGLRLALAIAAVTTASGCGLMVISYIAALVQPPKKVEAEYKLPSDKVVLVLVENRSDVGSYEYIKRKLTDALNSELIKNKLAAKTIPYDDIMHFRLRTPDYHSMAITDICKQLNADLVIYVHIDKFLLKDDTSDVWRGQMAATVFVKDRDGRLWPSDLLHGHAVEPIEREPSTSSSGSYGTRLARLLADQMADRIAKLFYDYRLKGVDAYEGRVTDDREKILQ